MGCKLPCTMPWAFPSAVAEITVKARKAKQLLSITKLDHEGAGSQQTTHTSNLPTYTFGGVFSTGLDDVRRLSAGVSWQREMVNTPRTHAFRTSYHDRSQSPCSFFGACRILIWAGAQLHSRHPSGRYSHIACKQQHAQQYLGLMPPQLKRI